MCLPILSEKISLFFQKLLDIMEDKGIEVIEAHSITEEAFENLGEESIPENVSPKSALNKTLEKRTTSIDQTDKNPINDCEETKAMKSNPLLGPLSDSQFWGFSLLKIKIGWLL